tara:strand:+ start:123764 stop:124042 length:279 start_codon:yes stop_codon:yes gene_type:complete
LNFCDDIRTAGGCGTVLVQQLLRHLLIAWTLILKHIRALQRIIDTARGTLRIRFAHHFLAAQDIGVIVQDDGCRLARIFKNGTIDNDTFFRW